MAWLTEQLGAAGGRLLPCRVEAVEELAGYDAVVNCSGGQGCVLGGGQAGRVLSCAGLPRTAAVQTSSTCFMSPPVLCALCCTVQGWAPATCLATPACTRCGGMWCVCGPPGCGTTSMLRRKRKDAIATSSLIQVPCSVGMLRAWLGNGSGGDGIGAWSLLHASGAASPSPLCRLPPALPSPCPFDSCRADTVVLGGTLQKGDTDMAPREADRAAILGRAYSVLPSLRSAEIVSEWVSGRGPSRRAAGKSVD